MPMKKMTIAEIREREKQLTEYWKAQQQAKQSIFPSSLPGSRGAISPLGGIAKSSPERKR